jgi:hypothetical protein
MPLLTITNLLTSPLAIQDPTGLYGTSLSVPASGSLSNVVISLPALGAIEPQLVAQAAASHITWTIADDPASTADSPPESITTVLVTPHNAAAGAQNIRTNLTIAGAVSVVLSAGAKIGQQVTVLDGKGDAGANNVTVTVAGGGTINGTAVISANYGAATFLKTAATVWQRIA